MRGSRQEEHMSNGHGTRQRRHISGARWISPLLVTFVFGVLANEAAAQIRPIDLGTLSGNFSEATAINDRGQVVGCSATSWTHSMGMDTVNSTHAFSWTRARGMIDLGTLGDESSCARAVNASGQVVGRIYNFVEDEGTAGADGSGLNWNRAFSWTAAGGMIDLGMPLDPNVGTSAVNASGQVVGWGRTANGVVHAFLWTAAGGMIDLGTLGGDWSRAWDVNASGQVVGDSYTANGGHHAFSWTATGGMIDLGTLGRNSWSGSEAHAVNASGQVVGQSSTANGEYHAFSWTAAGGMIDLGTLGGNWSWAHAVNASGQVVGWARTANDVVHAFSWTAASGMIDLGTLGPGSSWAAAVNDSGQVVGTSFSWSSPWSYVQHAFSWTAKGGMISLGTLGGESSSASAINAIGQVVGSAETQGALHAVLWPVISRTLSPVADTYVRAGAYAAQNFGSSRTLLAKLGVSTDNTRRTYLKFDVSHIKDNDRVTLRLQGSASSETGPVKSIVYAVSDTSWDERTVTWNTRPALGAVLGSVTVERRGIQWVELDVTKYVRAERRAGRNVVSLALRNAAHTSAYATFQSREAGNTGPRLVITP
jgi:probable HAF family extracellular repeat protein